MHLVVQIHAAPATILPVTTDDKPLVHVYSDGGCSPNPGPGGWAAVLISPAPSARKEISGAEPDTTNNRMELQAAIEALTALKRPSRVRMHTDSQYLQKAFADGWLAKWQRNGWKTSAKKPVANDDLWRELIKLSEIHDIEWTWVKGHADNAENNRCDELVQAARRARFG